MTRQGVPWTDEEVEYLKERWESCQVTAKEIAAEMTERFGRSLSRNAIIGRSHRMNLQSKKPPPAKKPEPRVPKSLNLPEAPRPHAMTEDGVPIRAELWMPPRPIEGVTIMELENDMCRWPMSNDTWNMIYCGCRGCDVTAGRSYCGPHQKVAFGHSYWSSAAA